MKKIFTLFIATFVALSLMASEEVYSIDFTQGQVEWSIDNVSLGGMTTSVWQQTSNYGMKATAYVDNTRYATESWLISPMIDLSNASSATLTISQARNYGQASQISVRARVKNGTWTTLSVSPWPDGSSWTFITSQADLSDFTGMTNVQIAFVYTSTTSQAATWEIKTVSVTVERPAYLTVSQLMTEYSNLNLSSGSTASSRYTVRGYVTRWFNGYPENQFATFYLDDDEYGSTTMLQCFRLTGNSASDNRTLTVGDYVEIQNAQLKNYNGQAELLNGSYSILSAASPAQFLGETSIANFIYTADTKNIYQLRGIVSNVTDNSFGIFDLVDETGTIHIYGLNDGGQTSAFSSRNIQEGDTVTLKGVYYLYNSTPEIRYADLVEHNPYVEPTPFEPIFSGQCGDDVYFSIDTTTMTLTLTGCGEMWDGEQLSNHDVRVSWETEEGIKDMNLSSFIQSWCVYVEMPAGNSNIAYLPTNLFTQCDKLEAFNVSSNGYYGSQDGVLFDKNKNVLYVYPGNKADAVYHVPNTVKKIAHSAFEGNKHIESITMGNNVTFIGMAAFEGCANLNSITLSNNLSFIGYVLLEETPYYNNEANWENGSLYIGNNLIEVARVHEHAEGEGAVIPPVAIDSNYVVKEGTRTVAMFAGASDMFGDGHLIKKVTIPASVEYVNFGAFVDNYALEEIVWNAKQCHDFEDRIPELQDADQMFADNPFLCFEEGASNPTEMLIKKISFGKGVEYIPSGICKDMKLLEEVYNYNPDPITVSENMFANVPNTCVLYVPFGSKTKYENAPVWKDFFRIREMEESTEGCEAIKAESTTLRKLMKNGQIFILRGDKTYTLQGQELK